MPARADTRAARRPVPPELSSVLSLADGWREEVRGRRATVPEDPVATAFAYCAQQLESKVHEAVHERRPFTVGEFAAAQRPPVSPQAVRIWCAKGEIPGAYRNAAGTWCIPRRAERRRPNTLVLRPTG